MSQDTKLILDRQKKIMDYIKNHYENFKKKGRDNMTFELAESRVQRLKELWDTFVKNDELLSSFDTSDLQDDYFKTDNIFVIQDIFDDVLDKYVQYMKSIGPPIDHDATVRTPTLANSTSNFENYSSMSLIKGLPQLELPEFHGDSSEWPHFRDMFTSLIHKQNTPKIMKLGFLHKYVKGDAKAVISSIPINDENYEETWETLKAFYENERRLVDFHLTELLSVPPMVEFSYNEIKRILNDTMAPLDALTSLGRQTKHWSDIIVYTLASKMHAECRREWQRHLGQTKTYPSMERIKNFLQEQALIYEAVERAGRAEFSSLVTPLKITPPPAAVQANTSLQISKTEQPQKVDKMKMKEKRKCTLCKEEHPLWNCPKFLQKSVHDRRNMVHKFKLCFNCFGSHHSSTCKQKRRCATCGYNHNSLLHLDKKENASPTPKQNGDKPEATKNAQTQSENKAEPKSTYTSSCNGTFNFGARTGVILGTAQIYVVGPDNKKVKARALIDNCSQPSFISQTIFNKLALPGTATSSPVKAIGGVEALVGNQLTEFKIIPHFNSSYAFKVKALVVPRVCSYTPPQTQFASNLLYLSNLNLADPTFLSTTEIDVLLGADIYAQIILENIVRGNPNEPIAQASHLGWIISGSIPLSSHFVSSITSLHCVKDDQLSDILQDFWRQEELLPTKIPSPEDEDCEKHFTETIKRDENGRYVVRLPFKKPVSTELGDSYKKAVAMLKKLEKDFESKPELRKLYFDFIGDYISSGHMIPVSPGSKLFKPIENSFFLPHHGVIKPTSTTTKLRTVFNGSSKTSLGISLNSLLHTGPNLLPELPDLVNAWRLYKYVFVADVKQMFRQIRLNDEDIHYQAVVWRYSPNDPIQIYYLTTVTYGLVSSPFQATRTLRQLAADYKSVYPSAAEILKKETYMDDMLSGGHTLSESINKQTELINLLKEGGLELRKWLSNNPSLLAHLPKEHLAVDPAVFFDKSFAVPVLGLDYQAKNDVFVFKVVCSPIKDIISKRKVLSKLAKIFDPMGWIAPVTITAKIFMQSLWLLKCDWDDPLPQESVEKWEKWVRQLVSINTLTIPRFVRYTPKSRYCEIHGFADASEKACSAVIYLRVVGEKSVTCSLQMAKTKVAPLKTLSIPRLELLGALMLSKLINHYMSKLPIKINSIHLWSDSKDVLFWLRKHPSSWQTYVANKCSAILTLLPSAHWHHVKSADNPADVASRGIDPELLASHPLWWSGPSWLQESSSPWSTTLDDLLGHNPLEEKKISLLSHCNQIWDLCLRFSTATRLFRVSAYVLRFVFKLTRRVSRKSSVNSSFKFLTFLDLSDMDSSFLSTKELHNSKLLWIHHIQKAYFRNEIENLERFEKIPESPKVIFKGALSQLRPVLIKGFLRVGGRLDQSLLPYDQKHPFIIPDNCYFDKLLARLAHAKTLHGGPQLALGTLRQEFWLINARKTMKQVIHDCTTCIRYAAKKHNQLMGDLPSFRATPAPPFYRSGVDYAGPFPVRLNKGRGRGTMKGYICLFICLVTRGIHLEAVEDYATESFIAAFHRFTSIWGYCSELVSDRGTNFVGADAELRSMFHQNSKFFQEICPYLAQQGTKWTWNPPGAPHMGGIWEAGVKSTKNHIRRVIGESTLTFPEMATLLRRIQACLNSRPLLPLSDAPADNNFLTPSHFLIQRASYLIPEPDYTEENIPFGRRWQIISQKTQYFWSRWRNEYLSSLQTRKKWTKETRSYRPGDVVFVRQENTPPGHWPLARVLEAFPDKYGTNRVCKIQTAKSTLKRPSVKLVLLVPADKEAQPPIFLETLSSNLVLLQAAE